MTYSNHLLFNFVINLYFKDFYMAKLLVFVAIVFYSVNLSAQDTLYKTDGSRQLIKIITLTQSEVRYKPYSNPDSPTFVILTKFVSKIVKADGQITSFEGSRSEADTVRVITQVQMLKAGAGRNIISLNISDIFVGMISANYEHILRSGKLGIKIPLSVGFNTFTVNRLNYLDYGYSPRGTIIGSGIDLDFYPVGQQQISYFVGPSLQFRLFNANYDSFDPVNSIYTLESKKGSFFGIFVQNGVCFQTGSKLNLSLELGLGYAFITETQVRNNGFKANFRTNIGIRF